MAKLIAETLVIGIGSTLRTDDAVGQLAALGVEGWNLPNVRALAVVQLTPELASPISQAKRVVFIDARVTQPDDPVEVIRVEPLDESTTASVGHSSEPRSLLSLARDVFGTCPPAWLISIPAADFSVGEGLSTTAEAGLAEALVRIAALISTF
jgi:hydrogenase maturation protease